MKEIKGRKKLRGNTKNGGCVTKGMENSEFTDPTK